jgi:hypothetical protein
MMQFPRDFQWEVFSPKACASELHVHLLFGPN